MKKSLMATLVAASMLSPLAFAAESVELTSAQMDSVTAGQFDFNRFDLNVIGPITQVAVPVSVAVNVGDGIAASSATALQGVEIRQR